MSTEVFKDFVIIFESADGTRRRPLTPAQFREAVGCPSTMFLADCVDRYNAKLAREGATDRAHLELRTRPQRGRLR